MHAGGAGVGAITHVVFWTGYTVDFVNASSPFYNQTLFARIPACQKPIAAQYIAQRVAASLPVYVISDSHWTGPSYRPFAGWYNESFSHARRVFDPPAGAPFNLDYTVYQGGSCINTRMGASPPTSNVVTVPPVVVPPPVGGSTNSSKPNGAASVQLAASVGMLALAWAALMM